MNKPTSVLSRSDHVHFSLSSSDHIKSYFWRRMDAREGRMERDWAYPSGYLGMSRWCSGVLWLMGSDTERGHLYHSASVVAL